jgi:integrase
VARAHHAKDASRPRVDLDPSIPEHDEDAALACVRALVEADRVRRAPPPAPWSCNAWVVRWFAARRERGQSSVENDRYRWAKWIAPHIGTKEPRAVTRRDVEHIRDALDRALRAYNREGKGPGRLAPKTAKNIWGVLVSAFKEMQDSKDRALIAPTQSPTSNVRPPDRGASRRKPFIYPSEAQALFACEEVPLEWRRLHAVALLTYARPGELRVLTRGDVDLDRGLISITKAWDYGAECVKPPKTRSGVRDVPIEATLLPLLTAMCDSLEDADLLLPLLSSADEDKFAQMTRVHLKAAGVTRRALFPEASSVTEMPVTFRAWRDTGITWLAITGLEPAKLKRRAGHSGYGTTDGYIKAAESFEAGFGDVFAPLPAGLVGSPGRNPAEVSATRKGYATNRRENERASECAGRDLNPYESYPTGT